MQRPESAALRHIFHAERAAGQIEDVPGHPGRALDKVGVIGAGTMGGGIAMSLINAGLRSCCWRVPRRRSTRAQHHPQELRGAVKKGKLTEEALVSAWD